MKTAAAPADDIVLVAPVPEARYEEVLSHVTPIFLRDEPLSRCFPPDASGARAADFRAYAAQQLRSGLCVAALSGGRVVAACLNRVLPSAKVLGVDVRALGCEEDDPLNRNVLRLLTSVHQRLDLFGALGVSELLEIGLISVEGSHTGRGLGTKVVKASLALGAAQGLQAVKADCTGIASAKCCQKAGLVEIYSLPYDDYKPCGRVVFAGTRPPNEALRVYAGRLHCEEPYVSPLAGFKL
ncbi:hypothetical protein R5R35_006792 [Gryllus longicercus]